LKRCSRPATKSRWSSRSLTAPWAEASTHRSARQAIRARRRPSCHAAGENSQQSEFRAQLEAIAPDAIVVVAYGRIIPPWMLALPRLGCINLHGSLLPKYRGAAPIQWAVAMGDAFTGNTTMLLEEGLDTGPILLQQTIEIAPEQTAVGPLRYARPRRRAAGG
jgi:methionyl-tRNA formyltransferase